MRSVYLPSCVTHSASATIATRNTADKYRICVLRARIYARAICSEKAFVCISCISQRKDYEIRPYLAMSGSKCQMYRQLFNVRFPSDVHKRVVATQKIREAVRAEAKKLEDEFKAREAQKSMVDKYIECRAKLWKMQELINDYKRTRHAPDLPTQLVFPFY